LRSRALAVVLFAMIGAPSVKADSTRLYSYDPANAETRTAAGPLTFEFRQGLFRTTMISVRATEAQATAYLKPANDREVGASGLGALTNTTPERMLYVVRADQDGAALIAAFCPGATRAWMAFSRPRPNQGLRVLVLAPNAAGRAQVCRTLDFTFHGAWSAPPADKLPPRLTPDSPFSR
jgi:hypothetical protein